MLALVSIYHVIDKLRQKNVDGNYDDQMAYVEVLHGCGQHENGVEARCIWIHLRAENSRLHFRVELQ